MILLVRNFFTQFPFILCPEITFTGLFNLRASDIKNTPVFYSYALISEENIQLYLHNDRITSKIEKHFESEGVKDLIQVKEYDQAALGLTEFVNSTSGKLFIPTAVNYAISMAVPAERAIKRNLVSIMKSVKNEVEAEGMKKCHVRDGAAIVRYLHWLEQNVDLINITELSGGQKLGEFRRYEHLFFIYFQLKFIINMI